MVPTTSTIVASICFWLLDMSQRQHSICYANLCSQTQEGVTAAVSEAIASSSSNSSSMIDIILPFLPFSDKIREHSICKMCIEQWCPGDEVSTVIVWCKFVDGINVFSRLPVHIQTIRGTFENISGAELSQDHKVSDSQAGGAEQKVEIAQN